MMSRLSKLMVVLILSGIGATDMMSPQHATLPDEQGVVLFTGSRAYIQAVLNLKHSQEGFPCS